MIGDRGSLTIVALLLATAKRSGGATIMAAIDAVVVPARIATSRRVRALIEWLEHCGAVDRATAVTDRRRRPIRPSPSLMLSLGAVARTLLDGEEGAADGGGTDAILDVAVEAIVAAASSGTVLPPEIAWPVDRRGGYLLMVRLIGAAHRSPDGTIVTTVSRKAVARRYGVSRAHLTALIARMEERGWLARSHGEAIVLDPGFDAIWRSFVSGQLAGARRAWAARDRCR